MFPKDHLRSWVFVFSATFWQEQFCGGTIVGIAILVATHKILTCWAFGYVKIGVPQHGHLLGSL